MYNRSQKQFWNRYLYVITIRIDEYDFFSEIASTFNFLKPQKNEIKVKLTPCDNHGRVVGIEKIWHYSVSILLNLIEKRKIRSSIRLHN